MFCEECGKKVEEGTKFCTNCGAPVLQVASATEPAPQPVPEPAPQPVPVPQPVAENVKEKTPKKPSLVPIIAVVIAIVVLAVAGVGIITSGALDGGFGSASISDDRDEERDDDVEDDEDDEEDVEESETDVEDSEEETEEETEEVEIDPDPVVSILSVSATSNLGSYGTKTYVAENLIDGDYETVWVEGVTGTGEGEGIEFTMDGTQKISQIVIHNGYLQSYHLYNANGRVSKVLIEFSNGYAMEYELDDRGFSTDNDDPVTGYIPATITLDEPIYADWVRISIVSAVAGDSYEDTCITEVEFH